MNKEDNIFVKISLFRKYYIADGVIYYRNRISVDLAIKYKWYFEYIAALLKSEYPKDEIRIEIGRQGLLQGDDYIQSKKPTLLSHKKSQLSRLKRDSKNASSDLFGFDILCIKEKIRRIETEIETLEKGEFPYYVPPTYINKVKEYIHNGKRKTTNR